MPMGPIFQILIIVAIGSVVTFVFNKGFGFLLKKAGRKANLVWIGLGIVILIVLVGVAIFDIINK